MMKAKTEKREEGRRLVPVGAQGAQWFMNPFAGMRRLSDEMERIFEGVRGARPRPWHDFEFDGAWLPDIEVFEKKKNLVVRADVPGMSKDDITVTVGADTLTIEGERKLDEEERAEGYYRSERAYGRFHRCLGLPAGVDPDKATASFKDGVLEVTMPAPPALAGKKGHRLDIAGA